MTVSVEPLPAFTDVGLKDAVAPAGRPVAESVTVCAEPPVTVVETAYVALPPCCAELDWGLTLNEKSLSANAALTVILDATIRVQLVEVPLQPPLNPEKLDPESGVAVKVRLEPLLKLAEQAAPQLIPTGELVTVPLPVPAGVTVRAKV